MPEATTGLWVAATRPIDSSGAFDHSTLARHAQRLPDSGCDGLVLVGGCGEGPSLSWRDVRPPPRAADAADAARIATMLEKLEQRA